MLHVVFLIIIIDFEEVGVAIASIKTSAKLLFTLIHARYLNSKGGLVTLSERFTKLFYGTCPRYFCQRQPVLPVGLSDIPCQARVQVYCPSCDDVYQLPSLYHRVDGAAFGTSIPHVFFKSFRHYLYSKAVESGDGSDVVSVKKVLLPGSKSFGKILSMEPNSYLPPLVVYEPKIFGFSLYKRRTPNVEETSASSLRKYESFSLYPPGSNSSTGSSSGMPTHSKFGLSLDLYRHYIPNPMDMSWLRTKPNPYRGQFVNKE